ncbi:MAG: hypothetical protein IKH65_01375 [Clostridia bacterium]|nr:hypothetical protein [Clostridia bacterium]
MKTIKVAISAALAVIIALSSVCISAYAADRNASALPETFDNRYPFVFVHGFNGWGSAEGLNNLIPYWGATCGDLMKFLGKNGYECYSASVGPISSAWDRACELYAQLTGTTVDYGAAHSAEHGHDRYGRTYEKPLFEGWGRKDKNGGIKKIHLIGHSFGGTTIRLFTYLMTYGCSEEIKASPDDVSPLFKGGQEKLIYSVTCICTPHNSASTYYFAKDLYIFDPLMVLSALYTGFMGRSLLNGRVVDFHLEQFGLSNTPGKYDCDEYFKAVKNFLEHSDDTCQRDLCPDRMQELNNMIEISPHIYYFSYAFDTTVEGKLTGIRLPSITTNPLIAPISCWILFHREFTDSLTGQVYDEEWKPNDSLCNTISETYPFDEPHRDYDETDVKTGIWNVMPVSKGDHGTAIGLLANKKDHEKFYLALAEKLKNIER